MSDKNISLIKMIKRYLICLLGIAGIIALDRWLKGWSAENLQGAGGRGLIPNIVGLRYAENRGAAFGILPNMRWAFVILGAAVIVAVVWFVIKERVKSPFLLAGLTLVVGGTLGNLIDRALDGFVVDMFEFLFVSFAIFNVADIALTFGGIITCLFILVKKPI